MYIHFYNPAIYKILFFKIELYQIPHIDLYKDIVILFKINYLKCISKNYK